MPIPKINQKIICHSCGNRIIDPEFLESHKALGHNTGVYMYGKYDTITEDKFKKEIETSQESQQ